MDCVLPPLNSLSAALRHPNSQADRQPGKLKAMPRCTGRTHWCNSVTNVFEVTNHFPLISKSLFTRWIHYQSELTPKLITDLSREPITFSRLNGNCSKLTPNEPLNKPIFITHRLKPLSFSAPVREVCICSAWLLTYTPGQDAENKSLYLCLWKPHSQAKTQSLL